MDTVIIILGGVIVSVVTMRIGVLTYSAIQRLFHEKEFQHRSLQLLEERISSAKTEQQLNQLAWNGYRKFVVKQKIDEASGVASFYLAPHDSKPLMPFKPGQYLTFMLKVPGREKPVVRCYSLSDAHCNDSYRITVKRVSAPSRDPSLPPGLISNYLHEQVTAGDILDVQAPRGNFVLEPERQRPAVFIAGGVGVTPLLSMVKTIAESNSGKEVLFFYGVRNGSEHAFKDQLETLSQQHANIRLVVCYSQPTPEDEEGEGRDYHHEGRINVDLLKGYLQATNYDFYLCGPAEMMDSVSKQLIKWGANKTNIFSEAFGPATISKSIAKPKARTAAAKETSSSQVTFSKSDKTLAWQPASENLLDFATANGIQVESGCRAGNCGTCAVAIKSGEVKYITEHGAELKAGTCLTCIAIPKGNIILDA